MSGAMFSEMKSALLDLLENAPLDFIGTGDGVTASREQKDWNRRVERLRGAIQAVRPVIEPITAHSDEEACRNLAQRMVGNWEGKPEQLVAFLRLLLRTRVVDRCQYAEDVGMPEHRCVVKCQYDEQFSEQELTLLIDYHDNQDAGAEAMDMPEASLHHAKRSKHFSDMRDAIRKREADTVAKMVKQ